MHIKLLKISNDLFSNIDLFAIGWKYVNFSAKLINEIVAIFWQKWKSVISAKSSLYNSENNLQKYSVLVHFLFI